MSLSTADLADILKSRQIRSVYYFHADHFEPWSSGINDKTAIGVERMRQMSAASPFGHKMSLFYCPFVPYNVDLTLGKSAAGRRAKGDSVVFGPRAVGQEKLARDVIRPLVADDQHEMHLHVHHEFWTRNDSNFDSPVSRWVNANSTAELDEERLDLGFRLFKEVVSKDIGEPFDRWAFVHGNWALAGSDPLICKIENELSMIMRHGGFGDFSFPAGRGYCDPTLAVPFTCLPIDVKRAYDDPASDPRPIGSGALKPGRFFIWNSSIKANFSSIDYYSAANRDLFKDPARMVSEWLSGSVTLGGDLFIKTHAHSMKWEYEIGQPGSSIPHCYPDVVKIFEELLRACDLAGVEFRPVTVNQVMGVLHALEGGQAATRISQGGMAKRPLLEQRMNIASVPSGQAASAGPEKKRVPADRFNGNATGQGIERLPPEERVVDKMAALERSIAPLLRAWLHDDPQRMESAGDFYRQLLKDDCVLQDYERAVLEYIVSKCPPDRTRIVEVGVGYGILSLLLAAKGYEVIAFEGDQLRFTGLQFLADSLDARSPGIRARLKLVFGWFPDAFDQSMLNAGRRNVLLMTNIVATATADRQEAILGAAKRFDDLIIDTTRFGVRRYEAEAAERFKAEVSAGYQARSSIWRNEPNEIWHFQTVREGDMEAPVDRVEAPSNGTTIPANRPQGRLLPIDGEIFNAEFLMLQRDWIAGEGVVHQPDDLYASKLERGVALETYEVAIAAAIAEKFERNTTIVEIGSGYGGLALQLAQVGFVVQGFEGDRRRAAACAWHVQQFVARYPQLAGRVDCAAGFFPDVFPAELDGKKGKLCLATNVTCTYTATNRDAIFDAIRSFDELVIDLSRFGMRRDTQEERDALRDAMAASHFEPVERLYFAAPYEYWRFRVRPAARISKRVAVPAPGATKGSGLASVDAVFPLKGHKGVLYSVFGTRQIEACPVCHSGNTVGLWRMPMSNLKEPISLFGGYFNQVPTLQVPGTVYCFDFCRDCESVFLNPAPDSQKEQYRKSDHYLRTMKDNAQWQGYENVFDRFAKWIPAGTTTLMDAACGIGQYLEVARKREPDRWRRLIGLELSEKYVADMRTRNLEAYAFDIDNDDLGKCVEAESVDFITFCEAFEHVERPLDALEKLLTTLRPGGRMFFTAQRYGQDVQAAVRPGEPIYIGEKVLKDLPQRLGCRVIDVTTSSMRYYVILEK